jgi:hypothetical protein
MTVCEAHSYTGPVIQHRSLIEVNVIVEFLDHLEAPLHYHGNEQRMPMRRHKNSGKASKLSFLHVQECNGEARPGFR